MKMRQVSKEEWTAAQEEYTRRARELAGDPMWHYSTGLISCRYKHFNPEQGTLGWFSRPPRTYRAHTKPGVTYLAHFSERTCRNLPMGVKVVCICSTGRGESTQYWLGEHAVGRCPHKTVPREVRT